MPAEKKGRIVVPCIIKETGDGPYGRFATVEIMDATGAPFVLRLPMSQVQERRVL